MTLVTEYTGRLTGGPDDGNFVSASVSTIYARDTMELWLDGKKEEKDVTIFETFGKYVWDNECFKWEVLKTTVYSKKLI